MAWSKLKSLFVVKEPPAPTDRQALEVRDGDLDAFELPRDAPGSPSLSPDAVAATLGGGTIDFQALYDQAGIPNTDEVEALEKFLAGLDMELPQASRVAAARAFLGAIGKAPRDVLDDAGRKIQVVRVIGEAKQADASTVLASHQSAIDDLNKKIEEHRSAMEQIHREQESARSQCAVEEGRLQGARTFFGHVGQLETPGPEKGKK
jgi:hypothetical protein